MPDGQPKGDLAVRAEIGARFAHFYAPLAIGAVTVSCFPLYTDVAQTFSDGAGTVTRRFGTLWEMAGRVGLGIDALGIVLLSVLVAALVLATLRSPRSVVVPVGIAGLALVLATLLLARPNTGTPSPALAPGGQIGVVLGFVGALVALAHVALLLLLPAGRRSSV